MDNPTEALSPATKQEDRKGLAIRLLAHGYTTRAVNFQLQDAGFETYPEGLLIRFRQQYASDIDDLREREEIEVLRRGLARRPERIRRLTQLAEKYERIIGLAPGSEADSPAANSDGGVHAAVAQAAKEVGLDKSTGLPLKVAQEYRRLLRDIGREADPLGIADSLDPNDPWIQIVMLLTKSGGDRQSPSSLPSSTSLKLVSPETSSEPLEVVPERNSSQVVSEEEKASTQHSS